MDARFPWKSPPAWPFVRAHEKGDPFAQPAAIIRILRDSVAARLLVGVALGAIGVFLQPYVAHARGAPLSLAAAWPAVALAILIAGPFGGFAALVVTTLALLRIAEDVSDAERLNLVFYLAGGVIVAGFSVMTRAVRRRLTIDAVRRNEEWLRLATEAGAIGLFQANFGGAGGAVAVLTAKELEILGLPTRKSYVTSDIDALVLPEDRAARDADLARAMRPEGDGVYQTRYRIRRPVDGALRWIGATGKVYFEGDRVARIVGVNRDITDETNAEATLREKARLAEQLTALAAALPGAIYSCERSAEGPMRMPYASPNIETLLGLPVEAMRADAQRLIERVPAEDRRAISEAAEISARSGGPWRTSFRYDHPQKGMIWLEGDSMPVRSDAASKLVWHGYLHDVTERKLAEEAIAASQAKAQEINEARLASAERMAASLAHEVNQPLAASATFLTVARKMLAASDRDEAAIERVLDKVAEQMLRAGGIIARTREFSRRGEPDKLFQNLHALIGEVCATLREDERLAGIALVERLAPGDDCVLVDRVQISQVLLNLIRNGAEAMAEAPPPREIVISSQALGTDHIRVSVADRGAGLSGDTCKYLFEPFYSTKPDGMGVGLWIARAIVEAHFGAIDAEPNPGGGTVFSFTLPLAGDDRQ